MFCFLYDENVSYLTCGLVGCMQGWLTLRCLLSSQHKTWTQTPHLPLQNVLHPFPSLHITSNIQHKFYRLNLHISPQRIYCVTSEDSTVLSVESVVWLWRPWQRFRFFCTLVLTHLCYAIDAQQRTGLRLNRPKSLPYTNTIG